MVIGQKARDNAQFVSTARIAVYAKRHNMTIGQAMGSLLDTGIWPQRFGRNYSLVSAQTLKSLLELKIFIAGCGGLGGEMAAILARTGAGHMRLCDYDVFEETNINRQRFCTENTLGQSKVNATRKGLLELASHMLIDARHIRLTPENLAQNLEGMQIVIDCLDNLNSKKMLAQAAAALNLPYLHGSVLEQEGLVFLDLPGQNKLERLYPQNTRESGAGSILGHTVAGTAALMSALLLQWLSTNAAQTTILHGDWSVPEIEALRL